MVLDKQFTVVLTPDLEDGGYTVTCKEIPAAISQGETIQEALDNLTDAIELCLEGEVQSSTGGVQAQ
jgi:antitoxin HicB